MLSNPSIGVIVYGLDSDVISSHETSDNVLSPHPLPKCASRVNVNSLYPTAQDSARRKKYKDRITTRIMFQAETVIDDGAVFNAQPRSVGDSK
jgi:hypothetical protein